MKEINEKTVARAKRDIVTLGIVRGFLHLITAAVTWVYTFGLLNGMEAVSGVGATASARWIINIYFKLAGTQFSQRGAYVNYDYEFVTKLSNFAATMEGALTSNWLSIIALPTIAILLTVCFVLYLRSRSLRQSLAAAERG